MDPQDEIDFAPAVMALGTAAFATRLLAALNCSIAIDHLAIMRFEDRIRPPVIESAVWLGGEHVATVQRVYLERFYRLDPVLRYAGADHRVLHLHRDEIMDAEYRRTAYVRAGLLERLTVAAPDGRRLIALNLYRREQGGPFDSRDVQRVEAHAPLLAALALKHVGTLGTLLRSRDRGDRIAALAARLHALEAATHPARAGCAGARTRGRDLRGHRARPRHRPEHRAHLPQARLRAGSASPARRNCSRFAC